MIRRLRLASGLTMLSYVAMHLVNHALGLVSLDAMEWMMRGVYGIWSQYPMQALLYGAFLVHYGLAIWALWQRRTLRLRGSELTQLILGFAIPILLARHVVANRVAESFFGTDIHYYTFELWKFFVAAPSRGIQQFVVLVVAWGHAMLGLHFWLRVQPWYDRWHGVALVTAVLVPLLSMLGAIEMGRQVAALAAQPGWKAAAFAAMKLPSVEDTAAMEEISDALMWGFGAVIVAVLLARVVRHEWQRRHGVVRIAYPDGRFIEVLRGTSVLEASRIARIPHASVCGGRGRCSTCRVRVRAAPPGVEAPGETERRVLHRIGAGGNVRLPCQLRPEVAVEVTPLLLPFAHAADGRTRVDVVQGSEREIAIVFVDIRGFTALSEGRLPFDIVFILNRYFAAMGRAVEGAGGRVDKFIGDGVMALFGVTGSTAAACRAALIAARAMSRRLDELNHTLHAELPEPLRIGIGIHAGPVIVGEMGYGAATTITAIGDAVNTASRVETLTKDFGCQLVVSEEVVRQAGLDPDQFRWAEVEIRGRQELLAVAVLDSAQDLPELTDAALGSSGSR